MDNVLSSIPSDHKQREAALALEHSYLVQAPAGSGKTELLIQRFLKALGAVSQPEQVLAITFTKKAAVEMQERLLLALKRAADDIPAKSPHEATTMLLAQAALRQDKKHHWQLLDKPDRLMIMTIDALAQLLLPEPLAILDNPQSAYQEAAFQCALHYLEKEDPNFIELLSHMDHGLDRLLGLFEDLLASRDQWLPLWLNDSKKSLKERMGQTKAFLTKIHLNRLQQAFPIDVFDILNDCIGFSAKHGGPYIDLKMAMKDQNENALIAWQSIATLLLTRDGTLRKKPQKKQGFPAKSEAKNETEAALFQSMKERFVHLQTILMEEKAFVTSLNATAILPIAEDWLCDEPLLQALSSIMPTLAAHLNLIFDELCCYDFIHVATQALFEQQQSAIPCHLKAHCPLEHLLIDECQDTSQGQFRLFEAMIKDWIEDGDHSLFMVGDPMQSIYRFRQADVSLFYQIAQYGIGSVHPKLLALEQNFRSQAHLVEWNNERLDQLFPQLPDGNIGAVPFHASTAMHPSMQPPICHWLEDASIEQQADYLATKIKACQKQYPNDRIGLLLRSRQPLSVLLSALKKHNIKAQGQAIIPLTDEPAIVDLITLMEISANPQNKRAWLALLRAPWIGLATHEIYQIHAYFKPGMHGIHSLEHAVMKEALSKQSKTMLLRALSLLQQHFKHSIDYSPSAWIEQLWQATLGDRCYGDVRHTQHITQAFFTKLSELSARQPESPFKNLKKLLKQSYIDLINPEANVHIMTVHKAKGLEFDHVFTPYLETSPPPRRAPLFSWHTFLDAEQQSHALFTMIPTHTTQKHSLHRFSDHLEREKERQERLRLLYVATTRAKKSLHLMGSLKNNRPTPTSFMGLIWPTLTQEEQLPIVLNTEPDANKRTQAYRIFPQEKILSPLDESWCKSVHTPTKVEHNSYEQWLGIVLHRALYLLTYHNPKKRMKQYAQATWQWAIKHGITHDLDCNAQQSIQDEILTMLHTTLQDERGMWILHPHHDHHAEYPIYVQENHQTCCYILDRTFLYENKRWIIDYKTTYLEEEKDLNQEKERHAEQLHHYAKIWPEDIAIHCGLYYPRQALWIEWCYEKTTYPDPLTTT